MLPIEMVEVEDLMKLLNLIQKIETKFQNEHFLGWNQVWDMEQAGLLTKGTSRKFMQTTESLIIQSHALRDIAKTLLER